MKPIMKVSVHDLWGVTAALWAATDSGLLTSLLAESASADELARRCGLAPRATGCVLDVLCAMGVVLRTDGTYGPSAELQLTAGLPGGLRYPTLFWRGLPKFLETGQPVVRMDGDVQERAASYAETVDFLWDLFAPSATELHDWLGGAPDSILDVGAGSGIWSLTMARSSPRTRVTALDLPSVLDRFLSKARSLELADRAETIAGDWLTAPIPAASFDRVLLANVVHLEPSDRARALVLRAAQGLRPGGQLVVVDALREVDGPSLPVYALHLAIRTEAGKVHPRGDLERWLAEAGLDEQRFMNLASRPAPLAALVATRRSGME